MDDSDVEFEDEWEEVQLADGSAAAAAGAAGDITIKLNLADGIEDEAGGKKRKGSAGRVYTKHEREDALQVHRCHTLCLLTRALLHDQAASIAEVQALLLSMLPGDLLDAASAAATSEDPSAAAWLPNLLRWFHRTFSTTPAPHIRHRSGSSSGGRRSAGASSSNQTWEVELMQDLGFGRGFTTVQEQLLGCIADRRGSCEQLASLLVALFRGVGFLTRSVWSLEPLPFRLAAVEALQRSKSSGGLKSRAASAPLPGVAPPSAAAAELLPRSKSTGSQRGRKRGKPSAAAVAPPAAGAAAADAGDGIVPASSSKRRRRGSSSKPADGTTAAASAAAAAAEQPSKRKGDEEFELQLAMALASTAAEAESRAKAAAAGKDNVSSPGQNPSGSAARPPSGLGRNRSTTAGAATGAGSLAALINHGAKPEALKAAAQQAAAATPKGWLWGPNPSGLGAMPCTWAEVYIGSSADGRWLHVDGQLGCWDQPGVVEAAAVRRQPLSYVVACQAGAPKDVTRRYAANFTVNMKWRDEAWWTALMTALRSTGAHVPKQLAAQMATIAAVAPVADGRGANAGGPGAAATADHAAQLLQAVHNTTQQQQKQEQPQPKRKKTAEQQQQQGQQTMQVEGQPGGSSSNSSKQQSELHQAAAPHSSTAATAAAATAGAKDVSSEAALRAAREDAELSARAAVQAAGAPTTIEGFRNHPLYILERHIPQKQALIPGAVKLGVHRGEPYYSRKDVQDLHTRAHWRRLGRDVKGAELPNPAKTAKKRTTPAAAGASGGGYGGSGGGRGSGFTGPGAWGPWQRNKAAGKMAGSSADGDEFDGEVPAAAAAAAVASGGAGNDPSAASKQQADAAMQLLYGLWQTEPWEPPPAVDGKVPRNEHGNVEVPPFTKALPKGTVHIALPNVAPICRSLGIDYAPALVGFDVQGGRNLPKILGVVVCEEFEEAVTQLYLERQAEKAAAEAKRQQREVEAAWRRVLSSMWTRLQLQRRYGNDPAAAAEATEEFAAATAAAAAAGSAKEIIKKMHASEQQQQQQQQTLDNAGITAVGQQAARARGGRVQRRPGLPPGGKAVAASQVRDEAAQPAEHLAGAAAAIAANSGGADGAEDTADNDHLEGVEVEEF